MRSGPGTQPTPAPNAYLDDRAQMRIALAAALTLHNEQVEQPLRERAEAAERELADLRERIGEGETPGSHCPWCGTPVRLDLDGLIPSHEHPTYFDECPGTHRRPSPEGAGERA